MILNLSIIITRGDGIARDDARAATFFELAAAQGEVHSHCWLGNMYSEGLGVQRSEGSDSTR